MPTLDAIRQRESLAFMASGTEFAFGDPAALPAPPGELAALAPEDGGVIECHDGGLTARVLRVAVGDRHYAVKQARPECRVRNDDGRTSFLNELRRHAELAALADRGETVPGVVRPLYGSLRHGLIISPWIDGAPMRTLAERPLRQLLATACTLAEHGFFEWDYAPGNVIDDGAQTWLFDFGYMYRFDPLRQINTAGKGIELPQFHPAERIESRNLFAVLLDTETTLGLAAALRDFALLKTIAADAYGALHARLAARGAASRVLDHYRRLETDWRDALAGDIADLYLRDAWRAHWHDVDDDLRGRSCTPTTLRRADWLRDHAERDYVTLHRVGALDAGDADMRSAERLVATCALRRREAERWQLG